VTGDAEVRQMISAIWSRADFDMPHKIGSRRRLQATGLIVIALSACASPTETSAPKTPAYAELQTVCRGVMAFDVTSPYFQECVDYMKAHSKRAQIIPVHEDTAEHEACREIGLDKASSEYRDCVSTMADLEIASQHL
jgi:hypothetical protein